MLGRHEIATALVAPFSDETLGQERPDGMPFGNGGLVTERLDGLRSRLGAYRERGATFACANLAAINAQAAATPVRT
jgi:hypothetical protein